MFGESDKKSDMAGKIDYLSMQNRIVSTKRFVFRKTGANLLLIYTPDKGAKFVDEKLSVHGDGENEIQIKGVLHFRRQDVKDIDTPDVTKRTFLFGQVTVEYPDYYKVEHRVLGIDVNLFISKNISPNMVWFSPLYVYEYGAVTVFDKINKIVSEDIFIGGTHERAIPVDVWTMIVKQFPNKRELAYYGNMRVENLVREYFSILPDSAKKLDAYVEYRRKRSLRGGPDDPQDPTQGKIAEFEIEKYQYLSMRLVELLNDKTISEKAWEREILKLILLLYPKYVAVLSQMEISENLTKVDGKPTKRFLDVVLVDADGHIDLIEIKKPTAGGVFRSGTDHDNFIPSTLLTQTIMQMEKYILYLQKGGYVLEKKLNEKYSDTLPTGLKIRVVNPKGILILGRRDFDSKANIDFEVIRRKYANIVDILTYDDMLDHFKNIVDRFLKIRGSSCEKGKCIWGGN